MGVGVFLALLIQDGSSYPHLLPLMPPACFSRYATTVRDSKRIREQEFLRRVKECVQAGGKVLIPVFALGRAQVS